MHVQALSIGIKVPPLHFSGSVHSLFRQACNLQLESHGLLTLLPSEKDNVPHGIRLNISSQPVFLDFLRVGQSVACRGGILRVDGADLSIDLQSAHPWSIDLQELRIDLDQQAQAHSWAVARSEWKTYHRKSGLLGIREGLSPSRRQPVTSAASEVPLEWSPHIITALLQGTRDFQFEEVRASVKPLIGLGPGLTPSGDDFLVGYLAGLWATAGNRPSRTQFLAALDAEISEAARYTNEISCAYLRAAVKGHVSEPIATLAQQLRETNDMRSVEATTQAALQVGHTSGADGVLGLLLGCLPWQSPALYRLDASVFLD